MARYWLRNRLAVSTIGIMLVTLTTFLVFINSNIINIANTYNETSVFIGSSIDFDVPSPSNNQVIELELMEHIERVIPYIYTNKSVRIDSSNSLSNVGVLLLDNFDSIDLTMYNTSRLIEGKSSYSDNPILVDYRFIKSSGLYLGDVVQIDFGGSLISFTIHGIYETNTYYQSYTIIGLWQGEQKTITENNLGRELNYSGAYIVSSNISTTDTYLTSQYKPYGRLRDRSEFDTDDAYQIHYDAFMTGNYANEITNFTSLMESAQDKAENYKQNAQANLTSGALLLMIIHISYSIALVFRKSEIKYFKSKKRMGSSFNRYYLYNMIFDTIILSTVAGLFCFFIWNNLNMYLPITKIIPTLVILASSSIVASFLSYLGTIFILKKVL